MTPDPITSSMSEVDLQQRLVDALYGPGIRRSDTVEELADGLIAVVRAFRLASPQTPVPEASGVRVPEGFALVPEDLLTHMGDWETACKIALDHSEPPTVDQDDHSYWEHQLRTLARIRAMLAAAPSPPPAKKVGPTTNAAAFELSIYEGVRDRLARLTAGTCSCNTKSPELRYHSERCHYRVAREALDLLLAAPPPAAKEAE